MAQVDDDREVNGRQSPVMTRLVALALVVLTACGGSKPSGSPGPGGSPEASGSPSAFSEILPADVTAEGVAQLERDVVRRVLIASAGSEVMTDDVLDAVETLRQELLGLAGGEAALAGRVAAVDDGPPLRGELAAEAGQTSVVDTLTNQLRRQASSSGATIDQSPQAIDRTLPDGTARLNGVSQTTLTSTASTLSGTHRVSMTIERLDANGQVTSTVNLEIEAHVDLDICPDANGTVKATYTYDWSSAMVGGSTITVHTEGTVEGLVGDDAFLHSYTVESSGTEGSTGGQAGSTVSRGLTTRSGFVLSGAPGVVTQTSTAIPPVTTITQPDPLATTQDYQNLLDAASQPAHWISLQLLDVAQSKWRSGACVKIESTRDSDYVDRDEHVPFTARVIHKIENTELNKPIVGTFSGVASLDPVDTELTAPADFEFVAGPNIDDVGDIHLKTTSNRGIGELDLRFKVKELKLELVIHSELKITKYVSYTADVEIDVDGRIRLERNSQTGRWNGTGTLSTMAFDSGSGGCHSAEILGTGTYDWVVRDVEASPGLPTDQIKIWMDNGLRNELPDTVTSIDCFPAPVPFVTDANVWENLFFLVHRSEYGANGFLVDGLSGGDSTAPWIGGQDLGGIRWLAGCDTLRDQDPLTQDLADVTSCELDTEFTLVVVDLASP
jgi:hypothetical protein